MLRSHTLDHFLPRSFIPDRFMLRSLTLDHCYRHAFGDQYRATDLAVKEPGKLELVFTPDGGGEVQKWEVQQFDGPGVGMGMYNTEESIKGFAKASFEYALDKKWYATCCMAFCNTWYNLGCTCCRFAVRFRNMYSVILFCCEAFCAATTDALRKLRLVTCMHLRCQIRVQHSLLPQPADCRATTKHMQQ
jgi:hypothetical protein